MYSRRRLLSAIGTGVYVSLAGCRTEDPSRTAGTADRTPRTRASTAGPASTESARDLTTGSETDTPETDTETETPEPTVGWSEKQRLPADQSAAGGGVLDGQLYYFGGFRSGPGLDATDRAFVYDPAAGSEGKWESIADMPAELWGPCGVATEDRVFSFGGAPPDGPYNGDNPTDAITVYEPGVGWRDLTSETGVRCPYRSWAMSGVYDPASELIYCIGGGTNVTDRESATDHGTDSDSLGRYDESRIWTFDPTTEAVTDPDFARLPEAKRWATVGFIESDGDRYLHAICGGSGVVGPTDSNYRLDLEAGSVT
ncbi:galactose oxidase, partial [Halobacteriales archaeon QS_3_64_16]